MLWLSGCQPQPALTKQQLILQAEAHLKAGEFYRALNELKQVLAQDPKNLQVHTDLGWIYIYTGEIDKAFEEIKILDALDPKYNKAYYLRGAAYHKLEQWEDALENYNEALKTEINNPELHYDIANVFLELNFPDAALKEFEIALRIQPETGPYEFGRCIAYRQMKHYAEAIVACRSAIAYSNDQDNVEQEQIQEVIEGIKLLQSIEPAPASKLPSG